MEQSSLSRFFGQTSPKKAKTKEKEQGAEVEVLSLEKLQKLGIPDTSLFHLIKDDSWRSLLAEEFAQPYFKKLETFVEGEMKAKKVFPARELIFNALNHTPYSEVRVVILGQDPYHGPGQAMGLCFSVPRGVQVPSSLKNIYKEIKEEIADFKAPKHGDLTEWANKGILLLNTSLTVRQAEAASHAKQGWETLTDKIVEVLGKREQPIVFLMWGKHAQDRISKIKGKHHCILKSPHPSGLSASKGFFGNKHFVQTNEFLKKNGMEQIDWSLPD